MNAANQNKHPLCNTGRDMFKCRCLFTGGLFLCCFLYILDYDNDKNKLAAIDSSLESDFYKTCN